MKEIEQCCIVNNFYWTMWSIMMLQEEDELDHTIFNWEVIRMKIELMIKQREWFGLESSEVSDIDENDENDAKTSEMKTESNSQVLV